MDTELTETPVDELTLRSVDEPILGRVEEICALLAGPTERKSAGNKEVSSSRRNKESLSQNMVVKKER